MSRSLVTFHNLSLSYGTQVLFEEISLFIHEGERIALVGENGSGKTTLLNLIAQKLGKRASILPQEIEIHSLEMTPRSYLQKEQLDIRKQMEALEANLEDPEKLALWGELHQEFEEQGGYERTPLEEVAKGLDFEETLDHPLSTLSSGERVRVAIGKVLLENRDLLLLDEPTNHLDREMIKWLEHQLEKRKKAILIVSHDRAFLNGVTGQIFELSEGKLSLFKGNYEAFLKAKEKQVERQIAAFESQESEKKELKREIRALSFSKKGAPPSTDRNVMAYDRRGEEYQKSLRRKVNELKKRLMEIEQNPIKHPKPKTIKGLFFSPVEKLIKGIELERGYLLKRGDRLILTGKNGAGKTTLLKQMLQKIPPNVCIGYLDQEVTLLLMDQTPLEYFWERFSLDEENVRKELHKSGLKGQDLLKRPFSLLSVGQRKRLMLLSLILTRPNVLFLDEPTNHLDLLTMEALEKGLREFEGALVAISHDEWFIQKIATQVREVEKGRLFEIPSG